MPRIPSSWVAVALSTVVHGAFAALVGGHGASVVRASATRVDIPIELVLPENSPLLAPSEEPARSLEVASSARHSTAVPHHHSYPVPLDHDAHPHDPALVHTPLPSLPAEPTPESPMPPASRLEPLVRFVLPPSSALSTRGNQLIGAGFRGSGDHGDEVPETLSENQVAVPARLVARGVLSYPEAARRAELEADVAVEIVVDQTGHVVEARALERAGYGLAAAAERSVRSYRFAPAKRDGRAVRVRMRWVVQFRLD